MTNFLTKIFKKEEAVSSKANLEFIKFKKSLLIALTEARKKGNAIGIYSDVLGLGMFVTGIEDIYELDRDHIVQLKKYDVIGTILIRETISLSEIKAICAFDMPYRNPHYNSTKASCH